MDNEKVTTNGHGPDVESEEYLKYYADRIVKRYAERAADADFEEDTAEGGFDQAVKTKVRQMTVQTAAKKQHEEIQLAEAVADNTSWTAQDPGPFLRGEVEPMRLDCGMFRSDGRQILPVGKENTAISETEGGKSWWACGHVMAEMDAGNHCVYIHFEEPDGAATFERLRALGATDEQIMNQLSFIGPTAPALPGQVATLIRDNTTLAILDGVNEAISLLAGEHFEVGGLSRYRRDFVVPFLERGITTLSCDHFPLGYDGRRKEAYGTTHKGNILSGARFSLENVEPFGRNRDGRSMLFVTKDRAGLLRQHGHETKVSGKFLLGVLTVEAAGRMDGSVTMQLHAPTEEDTNSAMGSGDTEAFQRDRERQTLQDAIWQTVWNQPGHRVPTRDRLYGLLRNQGTNVREARGREAIGVLLALTEGNRLVEFEGPRSAKGYEAISFLSAVLQTDETEQE